MVVDFISLIISSEQNLDFFKTIGFIEISREERKDSHDILVYMAGNGLALKIFIDSTHPPRPSKPEVYGLRYLSFKVDDLKSIHKSLSKFSPDPVKIENGKKFFFVRDMDNCPFRFEEE